jgi:glycerophosphoryl diester phosphodiesterase
MPERPYFAFALALLSACTMPQQPERPEVHGHRGCRGLLPENTIQGFLKAAELGCDKLELDVVLTADGEVLVSHEPWMDHRICLTGDGDSISAGQERTLNIYRMTLGEVQDFDCGSLRHPDFPAQQGITAPKPTLVEVVEAVETEAMENGWGVLSFNIEIKSDPLLYDVMQPKPLPFAQRVLEVIDELNIGERCIIQSFDPAVLEAVHGTDPDIATALLVDNTDGVETNLKRLSFPPTYYSAEFVLMDAAAARMLREKGIEPLVWTVNEEADMRRMIALGVNGIITDYPDRLIALLDAEE